MNKTTIAAFSASILAIIIAVVSWNHVYLVPSNSSLVKAVSPETEFPYGIQLGGNGVTQETFETAAPLDINAGQNQASWQNTTGATVFVRNYVGELIGTSTSSVSGGSYTLTVGTSSTAVVDNTTVPTGTLINAVAIATSTSVLAQVFNTDVSGGSNVQGVIAVAPNVYVFSALKATNTTVSASSSLRGFNINGFIEYTQ